MQTKKNTHHTPILSRSTRRLLSTVGGVLVLLAPASAAGKSLPPPAGNYSGVSSNGNSPITFSVSADRAHVDALSVPTSLTCTPGGQIGHDLLQFASLGISWPYYTFSGTTTQSGLWNGIPARFTYSVSGKFGYVGSGFTTLGFTGHLSETVTSTSGSSYTCTAGNATWSAAAPV